MRARIARPPTTPRTRSRRFSCFPRFRRLQPRECEDHGGGEEERDRGFESVHSVLHGCRIEDPDGAEQEQGDRGADAPHEDPADHVERRRVEEREHHESRVDRGFGVSREDAESRRHQEDVERLEAVRVRETEERAQPVGDAPRDRERDVGIVGNRPSVDELDRPQGNEETDEEVRACERDGNERRSKDSPYAWISTMSRSRSW